MVTDTIRTIRASIEDSTLYLQIEGYDEWRPPSFSDIVNRDMVTAASRLKTSVAMLTPAAICWVDFLTVKVGRNNG